MGINVKRHKLEPIFKITFLNKEIFLKIFFIITSCQTFDVQISLVRYLAYALKLFGFNKLACFTTKTILASLISEGVNLSGPERTKMTNEKRNALKGFST